MIPDSSCTVPYLYQDMDGVQPFLIWLTPVILPLTVVRQIWVVRLKVISK